MEPQPLTATCPHHLARPLIHNIWSDLVMLHWPVDPAVVQALLPPGLAADTHDGRAWVSLVPFVMRGNRLAAVPPLPRIATFCETNVRTYVVDADGCRGVWFHSLDAASLVVTAFARAGIGFPYVWSRMSAVVADDVYAFATTRRLWGAPQASSRVVVRAVGPANPAVEGVELFLSARWYAHSWRRGGVVRAAVEHQPWAFRAGETLALDDELVAAAGYRVTGSPIVRVAAEPIVARFPATSAVS